MRTLGIIAALLLLVACESKPNGPVPIGADDACASCRMAISERRYAAELLDRDGNIYKFDDIACMLRFAHSHNVQTASGRFYVTDYETGKDWIDARQAYFVRLRTSVSSPMASGLVAFRNRDRAQQAGGARVGHSLTFDELWSSDVNTLSANNNDMPAGR